jgi:hypothetical protein
MDEYGLSVGERSRFWWGVVGASSKRLLESVVIFQGALQVGLSTTNSFLLAHTAQAC